MKKYILILIAISIILTGCSKKLTWQDVESSYNDIVNYCLKEASNIEEITKQDYTKLLTQLKAAVLFFRCQQKLKLPKKHTK